MAEKQFVQIQVPQGTNRIEILEGRALDPQPPLSVNIVGKIDAPAAWWAIRESKINKDKCHVIVTDSKITLHIDEDDHYRHSSISGTLKLDDECQRWSINTDVLYDPKQLARLAKANEYLFANREEWVELVGSMMRFESNVQVSLKDIKETNGDIDRALKVTVSNKVVKAFNLKTKIFGSERHEYTVELGSEFIGHQVKFYLDSADLAFMIAKQSEELIAKNVKAFKDSGVPIIYT